MEVFWRTTPLLRSRPQRCKHSRTRSKAQPFVLEKQRGRGNLYPLVLAGCRKINKPSDLLRGFSCIRNVLKNYTVDVKEIDFESKRMIVCFQNFKNKLTAAFLALDSNSQLHFNHIVFHSQASNNIVLVSLRCSMLVNRAQ